MLVSTFHRSWGWISACETLSCEHILSKRLCLYLWSVHWPRYSLCSTGEEKQRPGRTNGLTDLKYSQTGHKHRTDTTALNIDFTQNCLVLTLSRQRSPEGWPSTVLSSLFVLNIRLARAERATTVPADHVRPGQASPGQTRQGKAGEETPQFSYDGRGGGGYWGKRFILEYSD